MKSFPPAISPLTFGLSLFLVSCDQKDEVGGQEPVTPTTTELAREAEFSPWMSRAELQIQSERLSENEYFSVVEGRLSEKGNQYRAIISSDQGRFSSSRSLWGLSAAELFTEELMLLRLGFVRSQSQVFTDSTGQTIHQLVMELPQEDAVAGNPGTILDSAPEEIELPSIVPKATGDGLTPAATTTTGETEAAPPVDPETFEGSGGIASEAETITPPDPAVGESMDDPQIADTPAEESEDTNLGNVIGEIETPDIPEIEEPGVAIPVDDPEAEEMAEEPETETTEPEPEVTEPESSEPEPEPAPQGVIYKVVKGDTLSRISRQFKVTIQAIKQANGLRSDMLRIDQVLKIPAKP